MIEFRQRSHHVGHRQRGEKSELCWIRRAQLGTLLVYRTRQRRTGHRRNELQARGRNRQNGRPDSMLGHHLQVGLGGPGREWHATVCLADARRGQRLLIRLGKKMCVDINTPAMSAVIARRRENSRSGVVVGNSQSREPRHGLNDRATSHHRRGPTAQVLPHWRLTLHSAAGSEAQLLRLPWQFAPAVRPEPSR